MQTVSPQSVGLSAARLERMERVLHGYVERGQLPGLITVVARHGHVAHYSCSGAMNLETGHAMQEDALFRIFSMTKPITSLAVLMLYEEGAFHLQTPAAFFLPALNDLEVLVGQAGGAAKLAPLERSITIHDLLTHTSGLGYGLDRATPVDALYNQANLLRTDEPLPAKIERIAQMPLHHQPGARYTYSVAYDVLGRIVEIVSGLPVDEFFKRRIFEPLGMVDTDFFVPPEKLHRLAALYTAGPGGRLVDVATLPQNPAEFPFGAWTDKSKKPAFLSGGGGLVSSTADCLRFAMFMRGKGALEGVRLVSRKTIELMTTPCLRPEQVFVDGVSYGLGWLVLTSPARAKMLGSPGAYEAGGAAHTNLWFDPVEDMFGLLMTQYIHPTPLQAPMDFKVLAAAAIDD